MDRSKYRLQVWYDGKVQGVGFRYKAVDISKGYDVSGFVRNLEDGRVHMAAVGDKLEVRAFVRKVSEVMADFIKKTQEREDFTEQKYKGFQIEL